MAGISSNGGRQVVVSTPPPTPQPAPAPSGWFAQNNVVPTAPGSDVHRGSTSPTNGTMPVPAPGATPPVPGTPPPSGAAPTPEQVRAFVSQYPATYEGAQQADAAGRAAYGAGWPKLLEHPTKLDKWQFPDGSVYDLMNSAGGPNASWVTSAVPESGGGGTGAPVGGGGSAGATASGNWQGGVDPSYGFRFGQGLKALERSAAAKGTLLTGGTLKALTRYGQDMASTEFGNVFDRNYKNASLGLNATNNAAQLGSSYGGQIGNLAGNLGNQAGNLAGNQAGELGNLSGNQINSLVGLLTGQGNANATGIYNGANAWRGTIGDLANIFGPAVIRNPGT